MWKLLVFEKDIYSWIFVEGQAISLTCLFDFEGWFLFLNSAGAREFVRITRKSEQDDLMNSAIAGFGTGAILGRLQG